MTRISICLSIVISTAASAVWAQAPAPTTRPLPQVTPSAEPVPPAEPVPTADPIAPADPPQVAPQWTYERQMQNGQGTVTNTHRYLDAPEDGRYVREHVVTNPRGEMTQTWERVSTGEGYQYRRSQVWTSPDGTPLRQHERTLSGTDLHNYTRERSHTLPDGRTINHTHVRSWDGTNGTMERSFTGPHGQTRESVRIWTPDEQIGGQMASMQPPTVTPATPSSTTALPPSQPTEKLSWWQKLNPFRKRGDEAARTAAASATRRGFTIGTRNSNSARPSSLSTGERVPVRGSQNTHRPSWAGGPSRSIRRQEPPTHPHGQATALRPSPGRGPNR
jgi:hypothetical protein